MRYPGKIPANQVVATPVMTIDLLPTIAALTGSQLPVKKIDGKNVWPVVTGKSVKSPHEAYFYYYKSNELHAVRYGDWKLYFPHSYRSLNGREGGKNGVPVNYEQNTLTEMALYNLKKDIGETTNVVTENPEIVKKIQGLADQMRRELGDRLYDIEGTGVREAGSI